MRDRSSGSDRKAGSISGAASGSALARPTLPRLRWAQQAQVAGDSRARTPSCGRGRRACRSRSAAAGRAPARRRRAAQEAAGLGEVGGQHAAAARAPLEDAPSMRHAPPKRQAEGFGMRGASTTMHLSRWSCRCGRRRAGRAPRHAQRLQLGARADARQHQHLRRLQRAGAQQHLAPGRSSRVRRLAAPPRRRRAGRRTARA
jgi:hypothetical protein